LKSCIASDSRILKFLDNGQGQIVLPPSFLWRKRQIDLNHIQVKSRTAGFFNGLDGGWIRL
jgi:hypothetical protein